MKVHLITLNTSVNINVHFISGIDILVDSFYSSCDRVRASLLYDVIFSIFLTRTIGLAILGAAKFIVGLLMLFSKSFV